MKPLPALALTLLLTGCSAPSGDSGVQLYFRADPQQTTHGPAIAAQPYTGQGQPDVESLFAALMSGPTEDDLVSPFPRGVTLLDWELSDGLLTLNLSEQYGGLTDVSLTLADYCIVLTMSQLDGVESVQIQSAGYQGQARDHTVLQAQEALLGWNEDSAVPS